ncbi:hypothetical protein [Merismopedia glauca]|uniref:Uncharacterized protein n=1 Tax=Merismopedia glauca CCAP 1448/3 TaxID=1296344 RepID=A0A2T1C1G1_9CYAN|nr:hypothetical protein [Merismopedia glauca]PSB02110.1 hypothetical protein C7B64_14900 [Merismopedia glauca CCAP 1448/3]
MPTIITTTGTSLLTLWSRVRQQQELAEIVAEAPASETTNSSDKISSLLQEVKHHYPKNTGKFAQTMASLSVVESVMGEPFANPTLKRVKHVGEDGLMKVIWGDYDKAVNIIIQTTGKGKAQTLKVASLIHSLLEK